MPQCILDILVLLLKLLGCWTLRLKTIAYSNNTIATFELVPVCILYRLHNVLLVQRTYRLTSVRSVIRLFFYWQRSLYGIAAPLKSLSNGPRALKVNRLSNTSFLFSCRLSLTSSRWRQRQLFNNFYPNTFFERAFMHAVTCPFFCRYTTIGEPKLIVFLFTVHSRTRPAQYVFLYRLDRSATEIYCAATTSWSFPSRSSPI